MACFSARSSAARSAVNSCTIFSLVVGRTTAATSPGRMASTNAITFLYRRLRAMRCTPISSMKKTMRRAGGALTTPSGSGEAVACALTLDAVPAAES
jgi:hypothetical protein